MAALYCYLLITLLVFAMEVTLPIRYRGTGK